MKKTRVVEKDYEIDDQLRLQSDGLNEVVARVLAARGIKNLSQLDTDLEGLINPDLLTNCQKAGQMIADNIENKKTILIVGDYDVDGATSCALIIKFLRETGGKVSYLVPDRFKYGYGLSEEIVMIAANEKPDLIITVDNGIGSVAGVRLAKKMGMHVLITDHHLPGESTPEADCIVNPNQADCKFPSKNLAGVGVIFYVAVKARQCLREMGWFTSKQEPNLAKLLDLVALGTVADMVPLDQNNRILVANGLKQIRSESVRPGIKALFKIGKKNHSEATCSDLGFTLGPRINAAGRLSNMNKGIECLLSESDETAWLLANELNNLNLERREIEKRMHAQALIMADEIDDDGSYGLTFFNENWHEGVSGIIASRLVERFNKPTIVFAKTNDGKIKGSGRSIINFHLKDGLDSISKRNSQLILKFGGHAMAAGLTIARENLDCFKIAFNEVAKSSLSMTNFGNTVETDGELKPQDVNLDLAETLESGVWGQGFESPLFFGIFDVRHQQIVGGVHKKLELQVINSHKIVSAIWFGVNEPIPLRIKAVYRLGTNNFRGKRTTQLILQSLMTN